MLQGGAFGQLVYVYIYGVCFFDAECVGCCEGEVDFVTDDSGFHVVEV